MITGIYVQEMGGFWVGEDTNQYQRVVMSIVRDPNDNTSWIVKFEDGHRLIAKDQFVIGIVK